ncbi:MAG: hypothetical protein SO314_07835 [Alphaproteobacteria bacterium]|nr:hypothetical protein [Alphaproteobacteria bacterium]
MREKGYTYYSSGQCPQYQAKVGTCSRDDHYLKCDAVTWCKQNGYNTEKCDPPFFVDGQCPNGKLYYKQCKEDRPRACREAGYVNSCSSGRLYATTNRCQWDTSYGKCCTASPSAGCPSNYSVNYDASRGSSGTKGSVSCSGNYVSTRVSSAECGTGCYECRYNSDCDATDKSCSYGCASTNSCGKCTSCKSCSNSCSTGSISVSCSGGQTKEAVGTTQCGNTCYKCVSSNPWVIWVEPVGNSRACDLCGHQSYCGSAYNTKYVVTYKKEIYCKNTSTGEKNHICSQNGYQDYSQKWDTSSACDPTSYTVDTTGYSAGSCNSDGTASCDWY